MSNGDQDKSQVDALKLILSKSDYSEQTIEEKKEIAKKIFDDKNHSQNIIDEKNCSQKMNFMT